MSLRRSLFLALAPLSLLPPSALRAQRVPVFAPYVARNNSLPGSPDLVGVALAASSGVFGARVSGGVRASLDSLSSARADVRAWTADADLLLVPGGVAQLLDLLGGFNVAGFVGVGRQGVVDRAGVSATVYDWSYGGTLSRRIAGPLALTSEARYRVPIAGSEALPADFRRGWEYRVGVGVGLGSRRSSNGLRRILGTGLPLPLPAPPASVSARRVLATADDYVGTRYTYGGTSPKTGFDCSGFVQFVFDKHGVELPRTSRQQASAGSRLPARVGALAVGDLLLFAGNGSRIDHVAIYAGNNRIIHSTSSGGGVRYDDLSTRRGAWFVDHLVAARRVVADGRSLVGDLEWGMRVIDALDPPDRAPVPR